MITVQTRREGVAPVFTLTGADVDPGLLAAVIDGIALVVDHADGAVVDVSSLVLSECSDVEPVLEQIAQRLSGSQLQLVPSLDTAPWRTGGPWASGAAPPFAADRGAPVAGAGASYASG